MDVGELGLLEIARDIIAVGVDQRHHRLAGGCISARAQREIGDDTVDGRADGRSFKIDTREVAVGERLRITRARFFGLRTSLDRKSTRLNSSHYCASRLPSSA